MKQTISMLALLMMVVPVASALAQDTRTKPVKPSSKSKAAKHRTNNRTTTRRSMHSEVAVNSHKLATLATSHDIEPFDITRLSLQPGYMGDDFQAVLLGAKNLTLEDFLLAHDPTRIERTKRLSKQASEANSKPFTDRNWTSMALLFDNQEVGHFHIDSVFAFQLDNVFRSCEPQATANICAHEFSAPPIGNEFPELNESGHFPEGWAPSSSRIVQVSSNDHNGGPISHEQFEICFVPHLPFQSKEGFVIKAPFQTGQDQRVLLIGTLAPPGQGYTMTGLNPGAELERFDVRHILFLNLLSVWIFDKKTGKVLKRVNNTSIQQTQVTAVRPASNQSSFLSGNLATWTNKDNAIARRYAELNSYILKSDMQGIKSWLRDTCSAQLTYTSLQKTRLDHDGFLNMIISQVQKTRKVLEMKIVVIANERAGNTLVATVDSHLNAIVELNGKTLTLTDTSTTKDTWMLIGKDWKLQKIIQIGSTTEAR